GKQEVIVPLDVLRLPSQPRAGSLAAQAAAEYLTTPYVFAGKSAIGADCSGLTSVAWAAAGLALPRDARQQVIMGRMVAARWYMPPLQPGDLLFFFDHNTGKIYHVGISIGGKRYLHSSPPEVQVSSYDPADPLYDEFWTKNFAIARRPIP
ncbi:MAG TPA: C40 family peptidase, partial [Candidatus Sumerlaeota bacterium]|nr:C40 family peptidase [Candidatus Sumerlaeota bacterium]